MWSDERRKIARRCGAKHISKSKCTKHTMLGPLLEVDMSKKCTPLWHEAHFQVKSVKIDGLIRRSAWQAQGIPYLGKSKQNVRVLQQFQLQPPHYTTLQLRLQLQLQLDYITLPYATLTTSHYTTLHYTTLNYTTPNIPNYTTFNYTTFNYTTLKYITRTRRLQLQLHYTNYMTLNYTPLHYATLHYTTLHYTQIHYNTLQLELQLELQP